jgi:HSP20 family protein
MRSEHHSSVDGLPLSGSKSPLCAIDKKEKQRRTNRVAVAIRRAKELARYRSLNRQKGDSSMANLVRWNRSDPFKELEEIGQRFNRIFGGLPMIGESRREAMTVADWAPSVDITEDTKEYLIKAEIPEVNKNDVRVTVQEGVLTIQGQRRQEKEEKDKRFHRIERAYGTFVRSFSLPEDVAEDNVKAEFKDGMLWVHLPKTEKPKPKSIEVKVA